jgi:hypothetical protein
VGVDLKGNTVSSVGFYVTDFFNFGTGLPIINKDTFANIIKNVVPR